MQFISDNYVAIVSVLILAIVVVKILKKRIKKWVLMFHFHTVVME